MGRKMMLATGLGVLSVGAFAAGGAANAAPSYPSAGTHLSSQRFAGEDDDGEDGEDEGGQPRPRPAADDSSEGSGSLAATGIDAGTMALLGALTLVAGGATYRVALRRQRR